MSEKKKTLFVCIHNSARSQMAEELLKKIAGDRFESESAGIEPGQLNPVVVEVLKKEEDIDISHKATQSVQELLKQGKTFDYVITVCDPAAAEKCPHFPGVQQTIRWSFSDPSQFKIDPDAYERTKAIKDEIKGQLLQWLKQEHGITS